MPLTDSSQEYLASLVEELRKLPDETEWVEFKVNNEDPREIGEYISALANSAAANGKSAAYLIWGVEDGTHNIVGTRFSPSTARRGNEPLETWLLQGLSPRIEFRFHQINLGGSRVVLLEIGRAYRQPVGFQGETFIRVGPVKMPLRRAGEREPALWRALDQTPFEDLVASSRVAPDDVPSLLDVSKYFDLLELPMPGNSDALLERLEQDRVLRRNDAGGWDITNLGALLFAKRIGDFPALERKAVRVVQYKGTGRVSSLRERVGGKGYASGFEGLIEYVNGLLPTNEVIEQALRKTVPMYPEIAVRELVANALIHQDFLVTGAGPMVEIFDDRVEVTNPGEPLIDTQRFVDSPPWSRNDRLASMMRRFRICEERGSGIDKVVFQVELFQLPAPLFEAPSGFTRAVLFAHRPLGQMDKVERIRACYQHACLRYVMRRPMTNTSVRERFGIAEQNAASASRLIGEALDAGLVVVQDPSVGTRARRYLPFWAAETAPSAGSIA